METEKLHSFILQTDYCPEYMSPIWFLQFELIPECGYWIRDSFLSHLHRKWKNIDSNTNSCGVSIAIPILLDPLVFTIITCLFG